MWSNILRRFATGALVVSLLSAAVRAAEPVNQYGGFTDIKGLAGKSFACFGLCHHGTFLR